MFAKSHAILELTKCKRPRVLNSILSGSVHDVPDIPNLPVPAFDELHIGPSPHDPILDRQAVGKISLRDLPASLLAATLQFNKLRVKVFSCNLLFRRCRVRGHTCFQKA